MKVEWKPQKTILVNKTEDPITLINRVARVCYNSDLPKKETDKYVFVKKLIANGHESPLEFVDFTWFIQTSRAIANELVRHRIASYMQESTRYVKYDHLEMLQPCKDNVSYTKETFTPSELESIIAHYGYLLEQGIKPEFARDFLPLGLITHLYCKMNLREFRHFLKLRTSLHAHPQMRELALNMLTDLKIHYPDGIFDTMFSDIFDVVEIKD